MFLLFGLFVACGKTEVIPSQNAVVKQDAEPTESVESEKDLSEEETSQEDSSVEEREELQEGLQVKDENSEKETQEEIFFEDTIEDHPQQDHEEKEEAHAVGKMTEEVFIAKGGMTFRYYLYTPAKPKEGMPLIVYLHGGSGKPKSKEGDLSLLTAGDGLPKYVSDGDVAPDVFMIFPQLPYGNAGWSNVKDAFVLFVRYAISTYKVNVDRVSLTGHSMGGKGTWDLALAAPSLFYKIAPLSGNVTTNAQNLEKLRDIPVWAVVGSEDEVVDPQSSVTFLTELQKVNPNAKLTVIEGYGHFDVPAVYKSQECRLLDWLVT